jgi:hypothetical protein
MKKARLAILRGFGQCKRRSRRAVNQGSQNMPKTSNSTTKIASAKRESVKSLTVPREGDSSAAPQASLAGEESEARMTKRERILTLLSRPEGASVAEMMQATNWQQHSVRGFLAGTIKKKLGLSLTSSKAVDDVRRYRIKTRRGR